MRRFLKIVLGATWLVAACSRGSHAQDSIPWPQGNRLQVTVTARVVERPGDTIELVYSVANAASSEQAAQTFVVRTFISQYGMAGPAQWLGRRGMVQDSTAAQWFSIAREAFILPGASLGGFVLSGVGLLDIVPYRVKGHSDPPVYDDSQPWLIKTPPSFWANAVAGFTIGIVPIPEPVNVEERTRSLRQLTERSCVELGWITDQGVCRSLLAKLAAAIRALEGGRTEAARGTLDGFLAELDAQHGPEPGKHVNDSAFWLLGVSAEFLLRNM